MPITNLYARYAYSAGTDLPIVVLMHGFVETAATFDQTAIDKIAGYGAFVIVPGMRARDSASGSADCSGRELVDVVDAIDWVRTNHSDKVNPDRVALVGYSGGGGTVLGLAVKYPDLAVTVASWFGISDYGVDATNGWWQQEVSRRATLESWIGGTPAAVPDAYATRDHRAAISNYQGVLWLYHDSLDASVDPPHSTRVVDALVAASESNYYFSRSSSTSDTPRWDHGLPIPASRNHHRGDYTWWNALNSAPIPTVPTTGTLKVLGYCITKRFEVWLGTTTRAGAGGGLSETATVAYDTVAGTYTVTPLTGATDVYIKQGSLTATASGISSATVLTVT